MRRLRAVWTDGRIVLEGEADWPEGSRLIIQEETFPEINFMSEEEQGDDPEAIRQWIEELRSIPPMPESAASEAQRLAWDKKMAEFNFEAVREKFESGTI